jgi:hypothetical protein
MFHHLEKSSPMAIGGGKAGGTTNRSLCTSPVVCVCMQLRITTLVIEDILQHRAFCSQT